MRKGTHSDAFKAKFRRLWGDATLSCSAIGTRLGITKSAVTGLRQRMDLPNRGSPIRRFRADAPKPEKPPAAAKPRRRVVRDYPIPAGSAQPMRLARPTAVFRSCQFPVTEGRPWRFCDTPLEEGQAVYCSAHQKRCWSAPPPRKVPELRRYP